MGEIMRLKELFSDRAFNRKLVRLTIPMAFQSLMLAMVAAADALMLGYVEQNIMSAVSLATQVQFVQNMIITTVTSGGAVLGAQYWGKGDKATVQKLFLLMLRVNGAVSLLFCGACELIPQWLMRIFTPSETLIAIGSEYLRIAGWSYLITGLCECYLTTFKVTEHERASAAISSGAVILNILLNAVFIYGLFGVEKMDARGAALATLLSRIVQILWAVLLSLRPGYMRPKLTRLFSRFKGLTRDFIHVSVPLLTAALLWGVGFTSYTAIVSYMGEDAAAANSVVAVIRDLFCCLCNGVAAATGIIVGNELGAGDLKKGRLYGQKLTVIAFIIGVGTTLLILPLTPVVEHFIKLTDSARSELRGMMIVMAFYMIGRCVNTIVINGVFAAGGDTKFDMYSLCVMMWGLAIPTAWLGANKFGWPVVAVYACTCLDEVGKIPWVMLHYRKYKWVKDLTRDDAAA